MRCPYCKAICNPLRFILYSRWTPYKCPKCGKNSEFGMVGILLAGIIGMLVAGGLYDFGILGFSSSLILGVSIIVLIMFLLKLKKTEKNSEQLRIDVTPKW